MIVVVTGPIASGKSTVAQELALQLSRADVPVAVIDLDQVHAALAAGGPISGSDAWTMARRQAANRADVLARDGVTVVIAEGSFNLPADRFAFADVLQASDGMLYVTLRVSLDEALERAQRDPTRGRSRDPRFLREHFAARRDVLADVPATDLVIDTEQMTAPAAAATIRRRLRL